eukprot:CAMPEP_0173064332 /NCGR_PEP_ID=MMETSP1102-20130122/4935_1 /TAXON_ID=49646 /ORGANISM="Geminigera sp., Strain Caron Lab Isolate" /LENGTH=108 /DNA_ID=CAMNT_0013931343 /DNA_START=85 /DNA_END=412 /DNA_ORIENTATION=-
MIKHSTAGAALEVATLPASNLEARVAAAKRYQAAADRVPGPAPVAAISRHVSPASSLSHKSLKKAPEPAYPPNTRSPLSTVTSPKKERTLNAAELVTTVHVLPSSLDE